MPNLCPMCGRITVRLSEKCRFRSARFATGSCWSAPPTKASTGTGLDVGSVQSERGSASLGMEKQAWRFAAIFAVV